MTPIAKLTVAAVHPLRTFGSGSRTRLYRVRLQVSRVMANVECGNGSMTLIVAGPAEPEEFPLGRVFHLVPEEELHG